MQDTFEELIHNMGGIPLSEKPGKDQDYGFHAPGQIIHEVGTTRMGDDPKTSVTNKFQQLHDATMFLLLMQVRLFHKRIKTVPGRLWRFLGEHQIILLNNLKHKIFKLWIEEKVYRL